MKKIIILPFATLRLSLCIVSIMILSVGVFAVEKYSYNSYPITTRTYKKLFRQFKNKLFVLSDGKVICPLDPQGKAQKISFSKKQYKGEISGKILKVINKDIFTLKAKEDTVTNNIGSVIVNKRSGRKLYKFASPGGSFALRDSPKYSTSKYYTVAISIPDTSSLFAGETFTANVIPTGAYILKGTQYLNGQKRLRKFDVLKPITAKKFKNYLDAGNKLYTYRKKLSGYKQCDKCQGKGHLPNPANKNRKSGKMAQPDLNCPDCKFGKNPVYKYTKIPVKPKRKRLASR